MKNTSTYLSLFFVHKNILRILEAAEKLPKSGPSKLAQIALFAAAARTHHDSKDQANHTHC
jgi:hypothetical protein